MKSNSIPQTDHQTDTQTETETEIETDCLGVGANVRNGMKWSGLEWNEWSGVSGMVWSGLDWTGL